MLAVLKLLLPAVFPSWRFFDEIAPSPRIELALLENPDDAGDEWRDCRPRPLHLGLWGYLTAFFWNPRWNEALYLATCAERLMQDPSDHRIREIRRRVRADLPADLSSGSGARSDRPYFRFRLVFVSRQDERLRRDVTFVSPSYQTIDPLER